jgi:hypothetical protein
MTRITLETSYGRFTVEVPDDGLDMGRMLRDLVKPVLLAAGYAEATVKEYVDVE